MKDVVILSAVRTPIGKFGGSFKSIGAKDLGVTAATAALDQANIDLADVDEVIFANARQAGTGSNLARQIGYASGLADTVPAYTVNKACGSSIKTLILAWQAITLGDADCILTGGVESMSNTPFYLLNTRWGMPLGHQKIVDGMVHDGFFDPLSQSLMGATAENLVSKYEISRQEQDEYAKLSQDRAAHAMQTGAFKDEITPVNVTVKRKELVIDTDEHPRNGTTLEKLAKLPPVFKPEGGTVTAGNSSGITDGAAAIVVMAADKAKSLGLKPLATIGRYHTAGVDPAIMGIGPVPAMRGLEAKNGMSLTDYQLIELNEAFAAQVIACERELPQLDRAIMNVNGGAIALGHPIGCTGARIVTTLLHGMVNRDAEHGLATLCMSGGMGVAMHFQRV